MTFKKGQSGNPKGRPKHVMSDGRSVAEAARDYGEKALKALSDVMEDAKAPPSARVSAASALLDRGFGKPTQPISGDDDAPPIQNDHKVDISNLPLEVQRMIAKIAL